MAYRQSAAPQSSRSRARTHSRWIYIASVLLFTFSAQASLKDGLYATDKLAPQDLPQGFATADMSTPTLVTDDGGCSSVYVSSNGHLLTAMHCLYSCLSKNGVSEKMAPWAETPQLFLYVINKEKLTHVTCDVYVDGIKYNASITAAGPGYIPANLLTDVIASPQKFNQARLAGFVGSGDFVVLRIPTKTPTACVPGDHASQITDASSVWSLGFPNYQSAQSGAWQKFLSLGKVTLSAESNPAFAQVYKDLGDLKLANFVFNESGTTWSTLGGAEGSSGSGVFNSESKLIGIVTDQRTPARGGTTQVRALKIDLLSKIDAIIVDQFGAAAQGSIFDCVDQH